MKPLPLPAVLVLTAGLAAQSFTVSPAAYTSSAGNSNNTIPFWSQTHRYQQIHGDLKGTPRVFQGMSLRKATINLSSATPRTIDVTVLMANSNFAASSTTFASNYVGSPTTVRPRGTINLPDWTTSQGNPEPWTLVVPFTTPFAYPATADLLWEWQIHSTTATSTYPADAYSASSLHYNFASAVNIMQGCVATGKTSPMSQSTSCYTTAFDQKLTFRISAFNAPNNAPSAILVDPVHAHVTIPGLCTVLHVFGLWIFPTISSSTGSLSMPTVVVDHDASWTGVKIFSQTISIDAGQPGLPFALSQGQEVAIPAMAPGGGHPLQRIWANSDVATSGSKEGYPYGLITRFTH